MAKRLGLTVTNMIEDAPGVSKGGKLGFYLYIAGCYHGYTQKRTP